ncbi:MAG TPA: hypothetical protein VFF78_07585 [Anaerolineaceae bacterium]|nr:hypothetical protein [Anaerolineaceae bacterium]
MIFLIISLLATGCAQTRELSVEEQSAALAAAEPLAANLLDGLERGDFAVFSRDFQGDLKSSLKETDFNDLRTVILNRLGSLQSRDAQTFEEVNGYINITYRLTYEHGQPVSLRLVLGQEEPLGIIMLAFDSPELNQP